MMNSEPGNTCEVSFEGNVSLKDYQKANFYHARTRFLWSALIYFVAVLIAVRGIVGYLDALFVLLSLAGAVILILLLILIAYLRVKSAYNSDATRKLRQHYVADLDGISFSTEQSSANLSWNDFIAVKEHKDIFVLYVSKVKILIIPKSFFKSEEDITRFKSLIAENCRTSKVKLL